MENRVKGDRPQRSQCTSPGHPLGGAGLTPSAALSPPRSLSRVSASGRTAVLSSGNPCLTAPVVPTPLEHLTVSCTPGLCLYGAAPRRPGGGTWRSEAGTSSGNAAHLSGVLPETRPIFGTI